MHKIKQPHFFKNPIKILYEDEQFMAFDKPSGLLVVPAAQNESNTLVNIVNYQYGIGKGLKELFPCHRLDRDTSGVILFAKGRQNQELMLEAFKSRGVQKKYLGLVQGKLKHRQGEFKSIIRDLDQKKFQRNVAGKMAVTRYRVMEERGTFTIVEVEPLTGRTNQIRIHFSQHKNPLVGDRKYSFARDYSVKFRRTALHALSLQWNHPVTGKTVAVSSPLPKDIEEFLEKNN